MSCRHPSVAIPIVANAILIFFKLFVSYAERRQHGGETNLVGKSNKRGFQNIIGLLRMDVKLSEFRVRAMQNFHLRIRCSELLISRKLT